MYSLRLRHAMFVGIVFCLMTPLFSQNLVPNPSFEDFTVCPININMGGPLECPPWIVPTGGTSDYFNACHTGDIVGVPNNYFGIQPAHTGVAYAGGLYYYQSWLDYREFLQVQLTAPMVAGTAYTVSLYYSLASFTCPIDKLGILISNTQVIDLSTFGPLNESPQLEFNGGLIDNTSWQLFTDCYVALGGEEWLTIGNFYYDSEVTLGVGCPPFSGMTISYVYIDDVSVEERPPQDPIELGAPEQVLCAGESITYNFDPGLGEFIWQDGSTSSSYVINTPGIYSVTVTTFCGIEEDAVNVTGLEPPAPIDLGMDVILCPWEDLVFAFDPALGDFHWQDGSENASFTVTAPGTYALTISNACGEVEDEIEVTFYPEPIVLFNEDTIMLCVGESVTLSLDPEIGEYFWQDGTEGPEYTVTQPGVYSVTVVNPCGSDYTSVVIDYDYEPILNLGADITICPQQLPYNIDLSGLPDVENFLWSDSTTSPVFTIDGAGSYGVTVSNDCFAVWDSIDVTIQDEPPVVELGGDTILCPGELLLLSVGNTSGTYAWQDNDTGAVYTVTQSGTYSVTVTNACGQDSGSIVVGFDDLLPTLDLGPDIILCPGEQATIDAGVTGVSFLWNNGSVLDSIVVNDAGTVILTISNVCASSSDTIQIILSTQTPDAGLPDQLSLCAGDSVLIESTLGGATYAWNTGAMTSSIIATTPGQYILTVTNSCGMNVDTTLVIDLGTAPVFDLGIDRAICPSETVVLSPGVAGAYLWQDGSTNTSFEAGNAGEVTLSVSNACGTSSDTIEIILLDSIPVLNLGPDTSICPGNTVLINPVVTNVSYFWHDGSTAPFFTADTAGTVILDIRNACGSSSDTIVITLLPDMPSLDLGMDISICAGDTFLLTPGISGVTYVWQDGSTGNTYEVSEVGQIVLTISNACGFTIDTVEVFESTIGPDLDLGPDMSACTGDTVRISPGINGVTYLWQDGSTDPWLQVTSSATIVLEIANSCGTSRDTIDVVIEDSAPEVDLGPDVLLCDGELLTLVVDTVGAVVEWQDGSTNTVQVISDAGLYVVTLVNGCGETIDSVSVATQISPEPFDLGAAQSICNGDVITLHAPLIAPGNALLWSTGSTALEIDISDPGNYTLVISNDCGFASHDIIVEPGDCANPHIFVPNVFSPNGDHINDVFRIDLDDRDIIEFQVSIYDRWGEVVFSSVDPHFEWKGDMAAKSLLPGVYVYQVLITRQDGVMEVPVRLKGDVTLIR